MQYLLRQSWLRKKGSFHFLETKLRWLCKYEIEAFCSEGQCVSEVAQRPMPSHYVSWFTVHICRSLRVDVNVMRRYNLYCNILVNILVVYSTSILRSGWHGHYSYKESLSPGTPPTPTPTPHFIVNNSFRKTVEEASGCWARSLNV